MPGADIRPDHPSFRRVADALDEESDGRRIRQDLRDLFAEVLRPAVRDVRAALMAGGGSAHDGEPLRQAIAHNIVMHIETGSKASASIRVLKHGMPRDFWNAPKRFNQRRWRHKVYGRDVWVSQVGAPGWFDDTLRRNRQRYRVAARRALANMAERIGQAK